MSGISASEAVGAGLCLLLLGNLSKRRVKVEYKNEKHGIYLKDDLLSSSFITIRELIHEFFEMMHANDIDPSDVRLISISSGNKRISSDKIDLDKLLNKLDIDGDLFIELGPKPDAPLPKASKLSIKYSVTNEILEYQWYRSITTLETLLNDIIENFSLESIERERIHIIALADEIDISTKLDKRLSVLGFMDEIQVDVIITPGQKELTIEPPIEQVYVKIECFYDGNRMILDFPCQTQLDRIKFEIEKHLNEQRLFNLHLFNFYAEEIDLKDLERTLQSFDVEPGQTVVAIFSLVDRQSVNRHMEIDNSIIETENNLMTSQKEVQEEILEDKQDYRLEEQNSSAYDDLIDDDDPLLKTNDNSINFQTSEQIQPDENQNEQKKIKIKKNSSIISKEKQIIEENRKFQNSVYRERIQVGLHNFGNTCYINSALQCLVHIPILSNFFLRPIYNKSDDIDDTNPFAEVGQLSSAYADFVWNYWNSDVDDDSKPVQAIYPNFIRQVIAKMSKRWDGTNHQDVHEFLTFFIDKLREEFEKNEADQNHSLIRNLFYGKMKSTLTCMACEHERSVINTINTLSVPIKMRERHFQVSLIRLEGKSTVTRLGAPIDGIVGHLVFRLCLAIRDPDLYYYINVISTNQEIGFDTPINDVLGDELVFFQQEIHNRQVKPNTNAIKRTSVNLLDCIDDLISARTLDGPSQCQQTKCSKTGRITQILTLEELPPILIIHLKRFSHNEYGPKKIETTIEFPLKQLDLTEFLPESNKKGFYDLIAMCDHIGYTNSGHYISVARQIRKGQARWYIFDDEKVGMMSTRNLPDEPIMSSETYLLIYMRNDLETSILCCDNEL